MLINRSLQTDFGNVRSRWKLVGVAIYSNTKVRPNRAGAGPQPAASRQRSRAIKTYLARFDAYAITTSV